MKRIYRGWMKREGCHCLFETFRESLEVGDVITDAFGNEWIIDIILFEGARK